MLRWLGCQLQVAGSQWQHCSGTDVCMLSLADLQRAFPGVGFTQPLACEVCPDKRQFIRTVHGLDHVFVDVAAMGTHQAVAWYTLFVVVVVAGTTSSLLVARCQPVVVVYPAGCG